jgi:hypothetical protein
MVRAWPPSSRCDPPHLNNVFKAVVAHAPRARVKVFGILDQGKGHCRAIVVKVQNVLHHALQMPECIGPRDRLINLRFKGHLPDRSRLAFMRLFDKKMRNRGAA